MPPKVAVGLVAFLYVLEVQISNLCPKMGYPD
jgi:hypothetical protein